MSNPIAKQDPMWMLSTDPWTPRHQFACEAMKVLLAESQSSIQKRRVAEEIVFDACWLADAMIKELAKDDSQSKETTNGECTYT